MRRLPLLLFLAAVSALNVASQSGRRINSSASATPPAPVQPPLTPEPEITRTGPAPLTELLSLPESIRERQIKAVDNNNFRLADFNGKVVVINLWASWCGPCRREVPEYEKVRQAYTDRDVVFIGLTTEDPRYESARVKKFARDFNFGFRLGYADREIARALMNGRSSIPQTMVIDPDGRIVSHWNGYTAGRSGDRLKQTIEQALVRE
ncbi:MAG TPA: TlpA disulfide reductase family protein [Pyrinomonadaceae bacterium]